MARKAEQYSVGILFPTKTETTIKYVTGVQTQPKVAKWEDGKQAMKFSKDYAKDLAFGLCVNGYAAVIMLNTDYLDLRNPEKNKIEIVDIETELTKYIIGRKEEKEVKQYLYNRLVFLATERPKLMPRKKDNLDTLKESYFFWVDEFNDGYMPEMKTVNDDKISAWLVEQYRNYKE